MCFGEREKKLEKYGKMAKEFQVLMGGCFIFKIMAGFCFFSWDFFMCIFFGSAVEPTVQAPWVGKEFNNPWVGLLVGVFFGVKHCFFVLCCFFFKGQS